MTRAKQRSISIGVPSGNPYLWLWEGTEDEKKYMIRAAKSDHPYVIADGKRYDLTTDEIHTLRAMLGIAGKKVRK